MKPEIRTLRKCQKVMNDLQYPGYPFQLTIVIDIEDQKAWVDYGRAQNLEKALTGISRSLLYNAVGCTSMTKRTFLQDQDLSTVEKILNADYDDFYIDDYDVVKFYLALNSAIYRHKKTDKVFIFACVDGDTEWVDVKTFTNLKEIEQYYNDYFTNKED